MPVKNYGLVSGPEQDIIGEFQEQRGRLLVVPSFRGHKETAACRVFHEQPIQGWYDQAVRRGFKRGFLATALMPPLIATSSMVNYFEEDVPRFVGVITIGIPKEPASPADFRESIRQMTRWCDYAALSGKGTAFVSLSPIYGCSKFVDRRLSRHYDKILDELLDDRFIIYI